MRHLIASLRARIGGGRPQPPRLRLVQPSERDTEPGDQVIDLLDDTERELWSKTRLSEEDRWRLIRIYRARRDGGL